MMLGKELRADSECALNAVATAVIFTIDRVSPSCLTGFLFLTTLVATRRCRCLLRSARVNVMPERLLSVISGILTGGIPGFRMELCCFSHPLTWPLVFFCGFFVFLFVRGHSNDTEDVIMHEFPMLVAIPFFSVQRRMASARSFNMLQSMLHLVLID